MGNELNIERNDISVENAVQRSKEVIVFESKTPKHTEVNFTPIIEAIQNHEGAPRVMYLGDGSGNLVQEDIKALPEGVEVLGVGRYHRMREEWERAENNKTNYIYEGNYLNISGSVDYVIVQEFSAMESTVLNEIHVRALDALKIGGIMFLRANGDWKKFMKTRNNTFEEISPVAVDTEIVDRAA